MHTCAWFGSHACLSLLMRNGLSVEDKNEQGQSPLHLAASRGHVLCLQTILKEMLNPNEMDDINGNSALHSSVIHNQLRATEELLKFETIEVNKLNFDLQSPLVYASNIPMMNLLLANGSNPTLKHRLTGKSVFDHFLEVMPEGCLTILDFYITMNGSSLQGNDLKITLDFKLIHAYHEKQEMAFLHQIVKAKKIELLKHPICESFLHMKWLQMRKYFYSYFIAFMIFLLLFNCMVFMDLSPYFQGNFQISSFQDMQTSDLTFF